MSHSKVKSRLKKRAFGREGANTVIYNADMSIMAKIEGEYGNFKAIYQEYVELPKDSEGKSYQGGVFFAYEGCGLGFRRGGLIMENFSKFVGHRIKE